MKYKKKKNDNNIQIKNKLKISHLRTTFSTRHKVLVTIKNCYYYFVFVFLIVVKLLGKT